MMTSPESNLQPRQTGALQSALTNLLETQEFNTDDLEEDTRRAITQARTVLGEIQGNLRRYRVRYSSTVTMIATVLAENAEEVTEGDLLPGVYDGIPEELIPKHIEGEQKFDYMWIERENGDGEEGDECEED